MSVAPAALVEGVTRQNFQYGLFSVLSFRPEGDARWTNGIEWESLGCAPASGIGPYNCDVPEDTIGLPKNFDGGLPMGEASAFTIYGSSKCNPVGNGLARAGEIARARLLAREEAAVENAFWTGSLGNADSSLTVADVITPVPGTATDPVSAIGLLEAWIASNYGSVGVIHVTRNFAVSAIAAGAVLVSGSRLTTVLGTPVIAGAGYPGTSPAGAAPAAGETWAYATPAMLGARSEVFTSQNSPGDLLDTARNDNYAVAERTYVLGFDPCGAAAVQTTLGCPC